MSVYAFAHLNRAADESRLQEFLERCSDYYLLHEGWPTPKDAAEHELSVVPDGKSSADLHVIGMTAAAGDLVAVAQLLRNYPGDGDWWIGMLLVAPPLRGRGVGSELLEHVTQFVRAEGGRSLQLVVSSRNPRAIKFWEGVGFVETDQIRRVSERTGLVDSLRVLSRELRAGIDS